MLKKERGPCVRIVLLSGLWVLALGGDYVILREDRQGTLDPLARSFILWEGKKLTTRMIARPYDYRHCPAVPAFFIILFKPASLSSLTRSTPE